MSVRQDTIYNEWCALFAQTHNLSLLNGEQAGLMGATGIEEAMLDVPKFTGYINGFMDKIADIFDDLSLIPIPFIRTDLDAAIIRLKRTSRANLEHFTIVTPEYLQGDMLGYLRTLNDVLVQLLLTDKNLLQPLEVWCEKMLGDKRYVEQPWLSLPPLTNQAAVHQSVLKEYFNKSVGKGIDDKPFADIYRDDSDFRECGAMIALVNELSKKALDGKMNKRAVSISAQIDRIGKNKNLTTAMATLPPEKVATIAALAFECAKQMEMLAVVLYQIRVVGSSFQQSIEKINKQL